MRTPPDHALEELSGKRVDAYIALKTLESSGVATQAQIAAAKSQLHAIESRIATHKAGAAKWRAEARKIV